jgi:hypothetical protein
MRNRLALGAPVLAERILSCVVLRLRRRTDARSAL